MTRFEPLFRRARNGRTWADFIQEAAPDRGEIQESEIWSGRVSTSSLEFMSLWGHSWCLNFVPRIFDVLQIV